MWQSFSIINVIVIEIDIICVMIIAKIYLLQDYNIFSPFRYFDLTWAQHFLLLNP